MCELYTHIASIFICACSLLCFSVYSFRNYENKVKVKVQTHPRKYAEYNLYNVILHLFSWF